MPRRALLLLAAMATAALILAPTADVAAGGGASTVPPAPQPTVRLQIASFSSRAMALDFIRWNQLGWNECRLGRELGVLPPGWDSLPPVCSAQVDVEVLRVESAQTRGRTVHRVMTRQLRLDELWGPLTAYETAGFDPVIVK